MNENNCHYWTCGHAAKAFCYENSKRKPAEQLEVQILISTHPDNVLDGMSCHTLPMVRFSDGWHAIEPTKGSAECVIKDNLVIGGQIRHIKRGMEELPPYKVMDFLPYKFYEDDVNDFSIAVKYFTERPQHVNFLLGQIQAIYSKTKFSPRKRPAQVLYEFCTNMANEKLPISVVRAHDDDDKDYLHLCMEIDGQTYVVHLDEPRIRIHRLDAVMARGNNKQITYTMSPDEYKDFYENQILKTKSRERK